LTVFKSKDKDYFIWKLTQNLYGLPNNWSLQTPKNCKANSVQENNYKRIAGLNQKVNYLGRYKDTLPPPTPSPKESFGLEGDMHNA
jgi:hypothetical protein